MNSPYFFPPVHFFIRSKLDLPGKNFNMLPSKFIFSSLNSLDIKSSDSENFSYII